MNLMITADSSHVDSDEICLNSKRLLYTYYLFPVLFLKYSGIIYMMNYGVL
jgi:hypothetical protein